MKHREQWQPGKYVYRRGRLVASRCPREVSVASRLMADLTARQYDEHLSDHARGRLLDLGCGKVPLYAAYRDLVSEVTCVDWPGSLHGDAHVDVDCDLAQGALPFADHAFDTIILSDVLEHLPHPERIWREMSRVLAPTGTVLMNVPFYYGLHEHPHDYYRYTEFALRRFVAEAGLELVRLDALGGAPEIMADLVAKNALMLPRVGRTLAVCIQWLTWHFGRTRFGHRLSSATSTRFPLGYFVIARKPRPEPARHFDAQPRVARRLAS